MFRLGLGISWYSATNIKSTCINETLVTFTLETEKPGSQILLTISEFRGLRVSLRAQLIPLPSNGDLSSYVQRFTRVGMGFRSWDTEDFFGMGERFHQMSHRGSRMDVWVEDGGFGFGTDLRLPKGDASTYVPIPFFISSRSYGLLVNSTWR